MAKQKKNIKKTTGAKAPVVNTEVLKEVVEKETTEVKTEIDFSKLPTIVTIIGTEKAKYLKTNKEYPGTHKILAERLIKNGDAILKTI